MINEQFLLFLCGFTLLMVLLALVETVSATKWKAKYQEFTECHSTSGWEDEALFWRRHFNHPAADKDGYIELKQLEQDLAEQNATPESGTVWKTTNTPTVAVVEETEECLGDFVTKTGKEYIVILDKTDGDIMLSDTMDRDDSKHVGINISNHTCLYDQGVEIGRIDKTVTGQWVAVIHDNTYFLGGRDINIKGACVRALHAYCDILGI